MEKPRKIVAIASGKGGVGKSTVTANLAVALAARGLSVGLLDADIYGPSQGLMLGVADGTRPEQEGDKWLLPIEAYGIKTMSMSFLVNERTPTVWRGPMAAGALMQMLDQTKWGGLDVLLVDMPPGTGDIQLTLSQKAALAGAVIVTTPQDIALLDARKGVEMFAKVEVPVLGVIQNMATHVCSECGHVDPVFGTDGGERLAADYGVPLLASLPLSRLMREHADSGRPVVATAAASSEAAAYLAAADQLLTVLDGREAPVAPTITMGD
jgi:ATP-binding protein involved in chromosome partitioning